jgi:hypothetical protein
VENEDAAILRTGKVKRTVHLAYDMALMDPDKIDLELTPEPGDSLTLLAFIDQVDGETHVFVMNQDYKARLLRGLSGVEVVRAGPEALRGSILGNGR